MNFLRRRLACLSILLPVVITGCSTTLGSRFGGAPQAQSQQPKTIAVVGDRPISVASGEPGDRVVVDAGPEPKPSPKARISGRVVDEQGEPVANVTVRLADGGTKGGKDVRGRTDKSGAFTLNGLRPGSTYALIAEAEDEEQRPLTGRATAKTSTTGVEIALLSDEAAEKATARKTARPAKARPISQVEETGEGSAVNREDIAPPVEAADGIDPGPPSENGRPQLSAPQAFNGWQNSKTATTNKIRPKTEDVDAVATSADETPRRSKVLTVDSSAEEDEDGPNPLPPAIEPGQDEPSTKKPTSARLRPKTAKSAPKPPADRHDSGEMSLAPDTSSLQKPEPVRSLASGIPETTLANAELPHLAAPTSSGMDPSGALPEPGAFMKSQPSDATALTAAAGPLTLPGLVEATAPSGLVAAPPGAPPAPETATQDVPSNSPASQPVFASEDPTSTTQPAAKAVPAAQTEYNPFTIVGAKVPEPTRSVDFRVAETPVRSMATTIPPNNPSPIDPAPAAPDSTTPKTKWGDLAAMDPKPTIKVEPTKVTLASALVKRFRPTPVETTPKVDNSIASCSYDARLSRLKDFRLPDLDGKPVHFQELDADFVLLDFWGTWCGPCLDSIPHLVELQKKYGPARLKVVGIACEELPPAQRKQKVEEVSRKLGINYAVLLSTMDGKPCPVQQALAIQAMPTMILLDRKGTVLWRSTGATPANEARLDRVLASQMNGSNTARR